MHRKTFLYTFISCHFLPWHVLRLGVFQSVCLSHPLLYGVRIAQLAIKKTRLHRRPDSTGAPVLVFSHQNWTNFFRDTVICRNVVAWRSGSVVGLDQRS